MVLPMSTALTDQPAYEAPAGGVEFKRKNKVSVNELAYSKVAPPERETLDELSCPLLHDDEV